MIDRLNIGGLVYSVRLVRDLYDVEEDGKHQPLMGDIRYRPLLIQICEQSDPQMQAVTLLHEALHGCLTTSGMPEHEESMVELLGYVLFRLLKDNPTLQADLLAWAGADVSSSDAARDRERGIWGCVREMLDNALKMDYVGMKARIEKSIELLDGLNAPEEPSDGTDEVVPD